MSDRAVHTMPDFCNRRAPFHFTTALMALMKLGVDIDRVNVLAVGEYENYRGEVREQEPDPGTSISERTRITLKVGYWSAVDTMPYQFFYGLGNSGERTAEWEDRARNLTAPFDAAVIRHAAVSAYQQLKYSMGFGDMEHIGRFLGLFAFDLKKDAASTNEAMIWTALFPTFHAWAGNPRFVERILRILFGYEFEIAENVVGKYEIPKDLRYQLGSTRDRLGQGTIMGRSFVEQDSRYTVTIKGVEPSNVRGFLSGQKNRKKLEQILALCMPGDLEYSVQVRPKGRRLELGKKDGSSYLGYNTCT